MKVPVQGKDFQVVGHCGQDLNSSKMGMVDFKYTPLYSLHCKVQYFQLHLQ